MRLVERGVRDVAPDAVEAAGAFGATRRQVLTKVKIPLAGDAIMLGVNQGIIMVLAVVVIGGLVGSGGLGYVVAQGLVRGEFGQGVVASLAILALGIALDRVTPGDATRTEGGRSSEQDRSASTQKEGWMSNRVGAAAHAAASALSLVAAIALAVVGERARRRTAQSCGTVTLNEQAWAGSTANTYVAKYVLEKRLGCKVKVTKITEIPVFQAMADGKVDAVLEDWNNTSTSTTQFVTKQKSVVLVGGERARRPHRLVHPEVPAQAVPRVQDLARAQGQGDACSRAPESGSQGMFLGGDPSYVQKDKQLIELLGLDFKHVTVGRGAGRGGAVHAADQAEEAGIFYWWTPQYLNANLDLVEVKLPTRFKGCQDDASAGGGTSSTAARTPRTR